MLLLEHYWTATWDLDRHREERELPSKPPVKMSPLFHALLLAIGGLMLVKKKIARILIVNLLFVKTIVV